MKEILTELGVVGPAQQFILDVWEVIQTWDDIVDGEVVSEADVTKAFTTLIELPGNPFYLQHLGMLQSILISMVIKWTAANQYEAAGENLDKAYMLRAGFYDVLAQVMYILYGKDRMHDYARAAYDCYSETLEDLKQEKDNA